MAFKAAEHAALDPLNTDYARAYLTPYKQKHPTSDHQYTLFFEILPPITSVYFSWINDSTCLHTTRANFEDPCLKEFDKLRKANQLETYDFKFHHIQFEVHPDKTKPIRCRSRYLGYEVQANTHIDSNGTYSAHAFNCTDPHLEISKIHISLFLDELHKYLSGTKVTFEFRIYKNGNLGQINQLTECHNSSQWKINDDKDDFVMEKI